MMGSEKIDKQVRIGAGKGNGAVSLQGRCVLQLFRELWERTEFFRFLTGCHF